MSIRDRSVLTDSGIALESLYRSSVLPLQQDCYRNNYTWPAKVVSVPKPASSRDLYALQNANQNLEAGSATSTPKFTFRAYILNQGSPQKCQSPHAFLQDPCLLEDSEDPTCVRQTIENCILVTSPESYAGAVPQVGDTVNIVLHQADQHGSYDLQFAQLLNMSDSSNRDIENFNIREQCESLQGFFDGTRSPPTPPAPRRSRPPPVAPTPAPVPLEELSPLTPPSRIWTKEEVCAEWTKAQAGDAEAEAQIRQWESNRPTSEAQILASLEPNFRTVITNVFSTLRTAGFSPVINYGWRSIELQYLKACQGQSGVNFSYHNFINSDGTPAAQAVDIFPEGPYWQIGDPRQEIQGPHHDAAFVGDGTSEKERGAIAFFKALKEAAVAEGLVGGDIGANWSTTGTQSWMQYLYSAGIGWDPGHLQLSGYSRGSHPNLQYSSRRRAKTVFDEYRATQATALVRNAPEETPLPGSSTDTASEEPV